MIKTTHVNQSYSDRVGSWTDHPPFPCTYPSSCDVPPQFLNSEADLSFMWSERWEIQASSSSISTPPQSLGCKNVTGFPCAPIFGSGLRGRTLLSCIVCIASVMSSTYIKRVREKLKERKKNLVVIGSTADREKMIC